MQRGADPTQIDASGASPLLHVVRSSPDLLAVQSSVCGAYQRGRDTCWSVSRLDYGDDARNCGLGWQELCKDGPPLSCTTARVTRGLRRGVDQSQLRSSRSAHGRFA